MGQNNPLMASARALSWLPTSEPNEGAIPAPDNPPSGRTDGHHTPRHSEKFLIAST